MSDFDAEAEARAWLDEQAKTPFYSQAWRDQLARDMAPLVRRAYRQGAEDTRERAAKRVLEDAEEYPSVSASDLLLKACARDIRALPLPGDWWCRYDDERECPNGAVGCSPCPHAALPEDE